MSYNAAQLRERALARQREDEDRVRNLQKHVTKMAAMGAANNREDNFDIQRKKIELEVIAREEAMERMTRTAMLEARRRDREQAQEEALALEMERKKREEESRRREIQRICEADPGLRDLQAKLHMAYISKERGEQLKEKKVMTAAEIEAQRALDAAMEQDRLRAIEVEKRKVEELRLKELERKRIVEEQLAERELREFVEGEAEAARERAMVDAILSKIRAEDEAEAAAKARVREETTRMIEEFKAQREKAIAIARQAEREEQARIAHYLSAQSSRQEAAAKAKAEDAAIRDAQYRAIVAEQEALRKKQEEEDALRWLLVEEEAERRREDAERARVAAAEASKREMMAANAEQRRIREQLAAAERAKEEALIRQFLQKCAEDDAKEAGARQAREEALIRYKAEIEAQRQLKTALYQQQKLEEVKAYEEAQRREEFKRRVIEEARRKLLEEHASILRGHLPRGVILNNADLEILKAFDRDRDGKLDADEMELAQAAFRAYDPGKALVSVAAKVAHTDAGIAATTRPAAPALVGGGRVPGAAAAPAPAPSAMGATAAATSRNRMASSVSFGGDAWDDPSARTRAR